MKIERLVIYCSDLSKQIEFYQNTLQVQLLSQTNSSAEFKLGLSVLELQLSARFHPYHFAVNIPSNQELEALQWLKKRVEVLKHHGQEIVDFVNWNAKSVYFYDADKNIVELIARKNLQNTSQNSFGSNAFLEISEIGLAVEDVSTAFNHLNAISDTPLYFGNLDWFCAAGDEHGLCIIINKHKKTWMPSNDIAYTADCRVRGELNFNFMNGKIIDTFL